MIVEFTFTVRVARCNLIQYYAIMLVGDLWWVFPDIQVSSINKHNLQDITEILLKVVLNTKVCSIYTQLTVVAIVDMIVVDLQLPVQSVPITTKAVSLNPVHSEMYSIQHYVIKFVCDLRQVGDFLRVLLHQ